LGLQSAIPGYKTVGYVEREAFAAAVIVARMADKALDKAPIWDDISTFPAWSYGSRVDLVSAGFPCQPVSLAGKGEGQDDPRWLWPHVARIVREVRPKYVFLENVPGLIRRGLALVLQDLAEFGFDAEWGVFSAAEVGAPHLRKRLFLLASNTDSGGLEEERSKGVLDGEREALGHDPDGLCGPWAAEPSVGRVADGVAYRVDRLRACGNGVVPQCAALAWQELRGRFEE